VKMDPLAPRVAARFLAASLQQEFEQRFEQLLSNSDNPSPLEVHGFRKWISENFKITGRVPKEGKRAQEELNRFWRALELATQRFGLEPGKFATFYGDLWRQIKHEIPHMVQFLSGEGTGTVVPVFEKKVGSNTYVNMVGASADRFGAMIGTIEGVFSALRDWRQKALDGGLHVVFAGPTDFTGTASGKYRREQDQLWIRATPGGRIDKGGSGYGGLAYVITHELGHRYERKHHVPYDFDRPEWFTSRYSQKDGEAFAELFALSNFGITAYKPDVVAKFEHLMTTGKMPAPARPSVDI
jgi:hypothetical protein